MAWPVCGRRSLRRVYCLQLAAPRGYPSPFACRAPLGQPRGRAAGCAVKVEIRLAKVRGLGRGGLQFRPSSKLSRVAGGPTPSRCFWRCTEAREKIVLRLSLCASRPLQLEVIAGKTLCPLINNLFERRLPCWLGRDSESFVAPLPSLRLRHFSSGCSCTTFSNFAECSCVFVKGGLQL